MRRLKRILHVIVGLGSGGAEAMLTKLVARLDRDRFEPVVVSMTDRGVFGDAIEAEGTEILTLGIRRGVPDPRILSRFLGVLRATRPDLIQSWMYHGDVLAALAGRMVKIPVLWNVRCSNVKMSDYSRISAMTIRAAARLSRWPVGIIVNSVAGQRYHEMIGYRPRAWHFIPNGFDVARFRPDPDARREIRTEIGIAADTPLVGVVARFDPMKDYGTLFAAASEIARRRNAEFLLVGSDVTGSNPALREFTETSELRGRVHMLAYRKDVERIMAALDVLVLSSAYGEGFPNVLGEAMACGVVCVATDVGDAAAVIDDCGITVPPRDPMALADAVTSVLDMSEERRQNLSRRARRRIEHDFSIDAVVRQYEDVYDSVPLAGWQDTTSLQCGNLTRSAK